MFLDEMDRDRSWYCHQCSANVQITEQYTCQRCDSGFIEELPAQPRRFTIIEFLKVDVNTFSDNPQQHERFRDRQRTVLI